MNFKKIEIKKNHDGKLTAYCKTCGNKAGRNMDGNFICSNQRCNIVLSNINNTVEICKILEGK